MFAHKAGERVEQKRMYAKKKKIQVSFSIDWQNYLRFLLLSLFNRSFFPFYYLPIVYEEGYCNYFFFWILTFFQRITSAVSIFDINSQNKEENNAFLCEKQKIS